MTEQVTASTALCRNTTMTPSPVFFTVSPPVLLTAIATESSVYADRTAQRILDDLRYGEPIPGRELRVYDRLDARLTFEDLLSKLRLHARR